MAGWSSNTEEKSAPPFTENETGRRPKIVSDSRARHPRWRGGLFEALGGGGGAALAVGLTGGVEEFGGGFAGEFVPAFHDGDGLRQDLRAGQETGVGGRAGWGGEEKEGYIFGGVGVIAAVAPGALVNSPLANRKGGIDGASDQGAAIAKGKDGREERANGRAGAANIGLDLDPPGTNDSAIAFEAFPSPWALVSRTSRSRLGIREGEGTSDDEQCGCGKDRGELLGSGREQKKDLLL